jgi:hypothetical protein
MSRRNERCERRERRGRKEKNEKCSPFFAENEKRETSVERRASWRFGGEDAMRREENAIESACALRTLYLESLSSSWSCSAAMASLCFSRSPLSNAVSLSPAPPGAN